MEKVRRGTKAGENPQVTVWETPSRLLGPDEQQVGAGFPERAGNEGDLGRLFHLEASRETQSMERDINLGENHEIQQERGMLRGYTLLSREHSPQASKH